MKLLLVLALVALSQGRPDDTFAKIDNRLLHSLGRRQEATADILITFTESTAETLQAIDDTRYDTRGERLDAMHAALKDLALRVQVNVVTYLTGRYEFRSLWISNQVYVIAANLDLLMVLAGMSEVKALSQEEILPLISIIESPIEYGRQNPEGEWGVKMIQAPEALALLQSATIAPAEVIVSTIDTGCRHTHEALRDNWVGEYGWYDPYDQNEMPMDINGHGTHTTGTICGKGGIGVYPNAKWVACRGCATSSCAQSALLECAQFIACPTLPDGSAPDCRRAPHLVSNSWGGGRGATWFDPAIAAFHTGHIIPLFSIGNSGPSCNTANSPGDNVGVIGVGSTTDLDGLSSFSSVGPTVDGRMKPDISAPGSNVYSAYNTADNAYRALSGTSMACPHAAGLTAFLFAYNPNVVYGNVTFYMKGGADTEGLVSDGKTCVGVPDNEFPNHHHGQGRINAFNSLRNLIAANSK